MSHSEEWISSGFNSEEAQKWIDAGCDNPSSAEILKEKGLKAHMVASQCASFQIGSREMSWGAAYSQGFVSLDDVMEAYKDELLFMDKFLDLKKGNFRDLLANKIVDDWLSHQLKSFKPRNS